LSRFEVVVLGASGTFPKPGGACTGFLVISGESKVWIDAGPGTFANFQRHAAASELTALVISHTHLDHILDLYSLYYAIRYGPGAGGPRGLPVYAPPGAEEHLSRLVSASTDSERFGGYFTFREVEPGKSVQIDPFQFVFAWATHPVPTLAMRIEAEGRTLAFTADSGPSPALVDIARGADVLIAEATLQAEDARAKQVHMTAEEAGMTARDAGVGRLILSHIVPGLDPLVSLEQACRHFSGPTSAAADNMRFDV
jgi:ribonuclease BN (tRNA processing enzyme)